MPDRKYDPMLQIQLPIGLIDDLESVHVEPGAGVDNQEQCKHCEAKQVIHEIRLAAELRTKELSHIAKAKAANSN